MTERIIIILCIYTERSTKDTPCACVFLPTRIQHTHTHVAMWYYGMTPQVQVFEYEFNDRLELVKLCFSKLSQVCSSVI